VRAAKRVCEGAPHDALATLRRLRAPNGAAGRRRASSGAGLEHPGARGVLLAHALLTHAALSVRLRAAAPADVLRVLRAAAARTGVRADAAVVANVARVWVRQAAARGHGGRAAAWGEEQAARPQQP
jgi:hypothetical protein